MNKITLGIFGIIPLLTLLSLGYKEHSACKHKFEVMEKISVLDHSGKKIGIKYINRCNICGYLTEKYFD